MSNEAAARSAAEPPAPPSEPARPFDINEYTRAAESATRTIAELNTALASVRQIAAPPAGEPAALDEVSAHVRSIAIHVGLVLAATVAVVLLLVLGYRMLARRLVRA
jgi:hypothetical protein